VQIFFAISGFLITSTSLRRWGALGNVSIPGFYRIRFARIAPLLLALLAILSCLHFAGQRWEALGSFVVSSKTGGLGRALVAALTFHINYLEAFRGYLPGSWDILWSLSVEEMFYLFFPLICRVFGRGKLLAVLFLVFAVLGPFARADAFRHNPVWYEYSYLGGMDAISLGCLTALLLSGVQLSRRWRWILGCGGAGLMLFCVCDSIQAGRWGLEKYGLAMSILAIGTCMVIAVASPSAGEAGWRSPRIFAPVLLLGRRSYEIYLSHMFVVFALFAIFVHAGKPLWAVPVLFLAVIAVAGALGELIARFYSEPMNRRLRKPSATQTTLPVRV
jgi:peptidoglycan/LPS O-acetylase OafA/YrhL